MIWHRHLQYFTMRRIFLLIFLFIMVLFCFNLAFYLISFNLPATTNNNSPSSGNSDPRFLSPNIHFDLLNHYSLIDEDSVKNLDKIKDLNVRVLELLRIRRSVLKELRSLERNRTLIIQELNEKNNELEKMKSYISKKSSELERIQLHIKQAVVAQKEAKDLVDSLVEPPLNLLPKKAQQRISPVTEQFFNKSSFYYYGDDHQCRMHSCFDYSRCSLFSPFYVYIYPLVQNNQPDPNQSSHKSSQRQQHDPLDTKTPMDSATIMQHFKSNNHVTNDPRIACVYMLIVQEWSSLWNNSEQIQNYLNSLPYWGGDGRNNIILNMNDNDLHSLKIDFKKAILVQSEFKNSSRRFRHGYDLVIPNLQVLQNLSFSHNGNMDFSYAFPASNSMFSPAKRKYFLSFLGKIDDKNNTNNEMNNNSFNSIIKRTMLNLLTKHSAIVNHNEFLFDFDCDEKTKRLCDNQTIILLDSTFTLISSTMLDNQRQSKRISFDQDFTLRFLNALSTGAIPIIISNDAFHPLPFEDVIDWAKASIRLPVARITELYVLLKTFSDSDIIEMRRHGNHYYQKYFSNMDQFISTFFSYFGTYRLQIPPSQAPTFRSIYYYNEPKYDVLANNSESLLLYSNNVQLLDGEEFLGPMEPPFPSLSFRRNYSITLNQLYNLWNDVGFTPFYTFPSLPFDPVLPSESKFIGSSYGFRPIGAGLGGSGKEFSESLGGNYIREQFTIIILTYERENVLLLILSHLKNLPYLNKVIVVWNSPRPPSPDIQWPDIGVDIVVIKAKRNSLNNRFLPFDEVKTEAILSIDDDTNLRHDEIVFAFRVWRENRERIVGFPARFHSWNTDKWFYNSSYTCEYSMILTGAAFFHKYYSYLYTYSMPTAIRDKVDEQMNCEDIAMNFLVSHLTRKPPIKVTSKWTFRCPACQTSLFQDQDHFEKRHNCINHFVNIYGYMPLLYSQFRADSVLFKTRVSHDKQKCFKYI